MTKWRLLAKTYLVDRRSSRLTADSVSSSSQPRHEAVFVDANLDDLESLLASLRESSTGLKDVFFIQHNVDGASFIADVLCNSEIEYDAVHIITHGSNGLLQIGSTTLTQ